MASACLYVMELDKTVYFGHTQPMLSHINVGSGVDCSIRELVETVAKVVGFDGEIDFDSSKPDGSPRKLLNVEKLSSMGWKNKTSLTEGLEGTYRWFVGNQESYRT